MKKNPKTQNRTSQKVWDLFKRCDTCIFGITEGKKVKKKI